MVGRRGLVLLLVSMMVGCGRLPLRAAADGWLAVDEDAVLFVRWTENDGALSGSAQVLSHDDATVDADTISLSGTRDGSRVSLTAKFGLGIEQTWHGKVTRTHLQLDVPSRGGILRTFRLRPAATADYNAAADVLRSRVEEQARAQAEASAAATAARAAADAVASANDAVRRALADTQQRTADLAEGDPLADKISAYADAWDTMQRDFAELKRLLRVKAECYEVDDQASAVAYDRSSVEYQRTAFDYSREQVDREVSELADAVKGLKEAYAALDVATEGAPVTATADYSSATITSVADAASARIATTHRAIATAASRASDYDTKAARLDASASALAESCSE